MARHKPAPRPSRAQRVSYRELSTSDESNEDTFLPISSPEPPTKKRRTTSHAIQTSPNVDGSHAPRRTERPPRNLRNSTNSRRTIKKDSLPTSQPTISSDNIIPNWTSLPHEVLVAIFRYASHPLRDEFHLRPRPAVNWILNTARICKAFCEPALTALYESPPLCDLAGPHGLLRLLKQPPDSLTMPYAAKIKTIIVDANHTLKYTVTGLGRIDLAELLSSMPQLTTVNIIEESDIPPYRIMRPGKGWTYPSDLFSNMSESAVRLRSWHWNAQMIKRPNRTEPMFLPEFASFVVRAHESRALQQLTELSISHLALYERKMKGKDEPDDVRESMPGSHLSALLAPLKSLRRLSLISCSAFEVDMHPILQALPLELESLTISNTQGIYSLPLALFLKDHGRHLKELILDHNQMLDLSFLAQLKQSCPQLRLLHMDLTFYNAVGSYKDKDPLFDALLLPEDPPTWPSTLQVLELYNLRQWGSDAVQSFFASLINAASDLPDLRVLVIKAILSMSWRDRAEFRDTWIGRLRKTFLRRSNPPSWQFASKRVFRNASQEMRGSNRTANISPNSDRQPKDAHGHERQSQANGNTRRSQRIKDNEVERAARKRSTESPETDASVVSLPQSSWKVPMNTDVQGSCEVVDINIDNFRPAERQYNEADFVDSEPEDDEWRGDLPTSDVTYAI